LMTRSASSLVIGPASDSAHSSIDAGGLVSVRRESWTEMGAGVENVSDESSAVLRLYRPGGVAITPARGVAGFGMAARGVNSLKMESHVGSPACSASNLSRCGRWGGRGLGLILRTVHVRPFRPFMPRCRNLHRPVLHRCFCTGPLHQWARSRSEVKVWPRCVRQRKGSVTTTGLSPTHASLPVPLNTSMR
jgi:hypothetical protein